MLKSTDLLHWDAAEPLWAPHARYACDCPQLVHHLDRWYLFSLGRNTLYRIADSPAGPWRRSPRPDLDWQGTFAGSRMAYDGRRWVTFPFLCAHQGNNEFADIINGEVYAIPRQLDFHADGSITERPVEEVVAAMRAWPGISPSPLAEAKTLSGRWDTNTAGEARSMDESGTLLLPNVPANFYFEADLTFSRKDMDANLLLRMDEGLTRGYELSLKPAEGVVTFRPLAFWDNRRMLLCRPVSLPLDRPVKLRVFLSGTVFEAFVDDRVALSSRIYEHCDGKLALDVVDAPGVFSHILIRGLQGDSHDIAPQGVSIDSHLQEQSR